MHRLFPSQQENETIYLVVREHPVRLILKLLVWFVFVVALILFQKIIVDGNPDFFTGMAATVTSIFTTIYILFLSLTLLVLWVMYYLNIQVITNLRIVDVYQVGLFDHQVSELHIDKIEDVTSETKGMFGTIFDYGNVYIQTAGAVERFEFENVPHPGGIEKIVLDLYEKNSNFAKEGTQVSRFDHPNSPRSSDHENQNL